MVKRPKSPEIIEDARYFTVCQPYPLNPNWLLDEHQKECATWIAECIGLEHIYAIHYKPSARGMVLLEVSKAFTEHERLLGEHRWSDILTDPKTEEKMRVSQVFHCFYAKGRDAQKDGWKGLPVKSVWFKNWSPGKGHFKQPYPQTHWCRPPVEDRTGKALCRPIPVVGSLAPPPHVVEAPVVGSATWTQTKNPGKPTAETLKKAWDEYMGSSDSENEPVRPVANAGTLTSSYPPLAGITTPAPTKSQPSSNTPSPYQNKKKKPIPLSQYIGETGGNRSNPGGAGGKNASPTWNKPAAVANARLSPIVRLPSNGTASKRTPRSGNAWEKPIQFPVSPAPVAVVKKETPSEDISSWGQHSAISTVDQEKIWASPLPSKKSKRGKARAATPQTPASTTSPGSPQPPSPQVRPTARDVPPHIRFQTSPESEPEDSDADDVYVALSKMKIIEVDDLDPDELEHAHISNWERGNGDAVGPETSEEPAPVKEDRMPGNLWLSEEDPRAIPRPKLICPTHDIACKTGICADMTKLVKAEKRKELEAKWEKEGKKKKNRRNKGKNGGSDSGSNDDNSDKTKTAEVDGDNFTISRPRGSRGGFRNQKKAQNKEVKEPSHIGRMRAFPDCEPSAGRANGEATVAPKIEEEGEIFTEW